MAVGRNDFLSGLCYSELKKTTEYTATPYQVLLLPNYNGYLQQNDS